MRAVCVDRDERDLAYEAALCREQRSIGDVIGFRDAGETLEWFKMNRAELALLDIGTDSADGLELAKKLREREPERSGTERAAPAALQEIEQSPAR